MMKSKVRCWQIKNTSRGSIDILYISYPEDNTGHDLISCLNCGHIYSVSVVKVVYIGPSLVDKLKGMKCVACGVDLSESTYSYPDKYLSNGNVLDFLRSIEIPEAQNSMVLEFDEIYG